MSKIQIVNEYFPHKLIFIIVLKLAMIIGNLKNKIK